VTWTEPKEAAGTRWTVETVWRWARTGVVLHRRTPGQRGRLLVAVDGDGLPVFTTPPETDAPTPAKPRARRRPR
jgi:hypothetical protein